MFNSSPLFIWGIEMRKKYEEKIKSAASIIFNAKMAVAFTGAGISVDSGLDDFRSPGGIWERYDPFVYGHIDTFKKQPELFWTAIIEIWNKLGQQLEPNLAHRALAELESLGKLYGVITQNIDFLHKRAGNKNIINLHGSNETSSCFHCGKKYYYMQVAEKLESGQMPPKCDSCNGPIKPNSTFLGEAVPEEALQMAISWIKKADLMIIIGSSLIVHPAAYLSKIFLEREDTKLIIINIDGTEIDDKADILFRERSIKVLPDILNEIKRRI